MKHSQCDVPFSVGSMRWRSIRGGVIEAPAPIWEQFYKLIFGILEIGYLLSFMRLTQSDVVPRGFMCFRNIKGPILSCKVGGRSFRCHTSLLHDSGALLNSNLFSTF